MNDLPEFDPTLIQEAAWAVITAGCLAAAVWAISVTVRGIYRAWKDQRDRRA